MGAVQTEENFVSLNENNTRSDIELEVEKCLQVIDLIKENKLVLLLEDFQCLHYIFENILNRTEDQQSKTTIKSCRLIVKRKITTLSKELSIPYSHGKRKNIPNRSLGYYLELEQVERAA